MQERKSLPKAVAARFCRSQFEKARTVLASLNFPTSLFDNALEHQQRIESLNRQDIEECAEPSARFLADVFRFTAVATKSKENEATLYQIGYHVGKVIYLIDSCIDIVDDLEKERFNALLAAYPNNNGGVSEHSQSEVVNTVITSLNAIQALAKDLTMKRHEGLINNVLLYGFPKRIHYEIQQSIRKLKKNGTISFKYLPHTALASALCLFLLTAQSAEASGWVWGKEMAPEYSMGDFRAYGYVCCDNPGECPICLILDCVCNPCLCEMYERETWLYCCCQLPKSILTASGVLSGVWGIGSGVHASAETVLEYTKKRKEAKRKRRQELVQRITGELRSVESDIRAIAERLDIAFPTDYQSALPDWLTNLTFH